MRAARAGRGTTSVWSKVWTINGTIATIKSSLSWEGPSLKKTLRMHICYSTRNKFSLLLKVIYQSKIIEKRSNLTPLSNRKTKKELFKYLIVPL
jgi:hypothetical protein